MKRSIAIADRRTYAEGRLLWLVLLAGAVLVALLWATAASGATAYYSIEGWLAEGVVPTQYFAFDIDRGIARTAPFSLRTWHYGGTPTGQTNAAGDTIPGGSFDPILRLYHLGGSAIVTNDDGPFGLDSLINWSTPGMPEELGDGSYGLDLVPYSGNGYWAVDLEADAARFTLADAGSFGSDFAAVYSLKIGSDDPRVPAKFALASNNELEIYYYHDFYGRLVVGQSGSATATIEGDLDTGHSVLGWDPGSVGSMILDYGDWEDHHTYDATYIGLYGEGNLDVRDHGSAIFNYNLVLAEEPGSEGNVTVSGPYSYLKVYSKIEIGAGGTGTLRVDNQGHLNSYLLGNQDPDVVASLSLSTGTVDIDGHESLWETDPLVVGGAGQGIVRITNGGKIDTHGSAYIGKTSGAAASSVTVAGLSPEITKATWLIDRNLHIAGDESGPSSAAFSKLAISTGGLVDVSGTTTVWESGGSLDLRGGEMETGSLIVRPGATFTHTDGTLTVNGGTFDPGTPSGGYVITGDSGTDRPKIVLTNGATTTLAGELWVGSDNYGELTIDNQATLRVGALLSSFESVAPTSSKITVTGFNSRLIIAGASATFPNHAPLLIGLSGPSELHINAGGQVQVEQGGAWLGSVTIGAPPSLHAGSGQIVVEGQNSLLEARHVEWNAVGADSYVCIRDRGVVHSTDLSNRSRIAPQSSHKIEVDVSDFDSLLQIDNELVVSGEGQANLGPGTAKLIIRNQARARVASVLYVGGYANFAADGTAQVTVASGGQVTAGSVRVWQSGSVELDNGVISTGNVELSGGTLRGTGQVTGGGELSNSGLVSPGLITPGAAVGAIHVAGDYVQFAAGALKMEIGGLAPSQFDRLQVDGAATLGGSLRIDLVDPTGGSNPFQPSAGNTFPLISAGLLGVPTFSDIIVPDLGPDLRFAVLADLLNSQLLAKVFWNGDYNFDGVVDAADYTVWRDTLGSTTDLRANGDNTGASAGRIDQADYLAWKSHFGATAGGGSLVMSGASLDTSGGIPEPAAPMLLSFAAIWLICWRNAGRAGK